MRNAELFDATCQFRDAGHPLEDTEAQLLARALADGLTEAEARPYHPLGLCPDLQGTARRGRAIAYRAVTTATACHHTAPVHRERSTMALPVTLDDGFVHLIDACFQPGEFVAIAPAAENDDGEIVPRRGVTLTAAEWKSKVTTKGGIDRVFGTKLGLFLRINPMAKDGAKNEDVTAFRHVLVEFDRDETGKPIPKEEQYHAVVASGMPVAALIDSGNKSLHAWIRVDAPDETEYKRRVETIWSWFSGLNLDRQNRNPSRLSTLPGRLAHGRNSVQHHGTPGNPLKMPRQRTRSSRSRRSPPTTRPTMPAFAIKPIAPLRSVLIQAENDVGDLAEMYQGVRQGMGLTPEQEVLLDERIFIYRDTTRTGADFVDAASSLVDRHKPDLVWADPLLNYIGDDISEQRVISEFCCKLLNEVSLRTGVIWCLLHHTGKPSKDPKTSSHWTASDLAYSGLGSSALTNWSRETAVLVRLKTAEGEPPTFQFSMTKRRKRAGLIDTAGEPTDTIFLRHATHGGICWEQCEPPAAEEEKAAGRYKMGRKSAFDFEGFQAVLAPHGGTLTRGNVAQVAAAMKCSERTAWNFWKKLKTNDS
jgi:hypothetical protein